LAHWIDSEIKLAGMLDELKSATVLAVDTEFIRTNTFHPKIALIQISNGVDCWLVDVLAVKNFGGLKMLLESPDRQLIFHACAEDLEVLDYALGIRPNTIFDTQIAAGISNIGYSMGYARLVKEIFEVELDKDETRSDWLARPLTPRQLQYAATDVLYLHKLHELLSQRLEDQGRQDWFIEESLAVYAMVAGRKESDDYYMRIKSAWKLEQSALKILKRLCIWRERTARERNKPRGHIVKDNSLVEVARRQPTSLTHLGGIDDLHPGLIKRYGLDLLAQVEAANLDADIDALPQPLTKAEVVVLKGMRNSLVAVADKVLIPQEFLFSKKDLELILRGVIAGRNDWPKRFTGGWREPLVIPVLKQTLNELM
tara:strand:- start:348 stop:1457 length:1110 start_codon:yes stop_codon:yes gene_type:complete